MRTPSCLGIALIVGAAASVHAAAAQEFTEETALGEVRTFAPAPIDPAVTQGLDAQGRVVWASGPSGWVAFRLSADGRIEEELDSFGDRTLFTYESKGYLSEALFLGAGRERAERFLRDQEGDLFAEAVEEPSNPKLAARIAAIGASPFVSDHYLNAPDQPVHRLLESSFASRRIHEPADKPADGEVVYAETTATSSLSMTVTRRELPEGSLFEDDWGGWQLITHDKDQRIAAVDDVTGHVARIARDKEGRPTHVLFGDGWVLHYVYDEYGNWTKKQIAELATGKIYFEANRQRGESEIAEIVHKGAVPPRRVGRLWLRDSGPMAEFDDDFSPGGSLVVTVGGDPYALIPLEIGSSKPVPIYSFPLFGDDRMRERVDYTSDEIRIHLETEPGGPSSIAPSSVVIVVPRRATPVEPGSSYTYNAGRRRRNGGGTPRPIVAKSCPSGPKIFSLTITVCARPTQLPTIPPPPGSIGGGGPSTPGTRPGNDRGQGAGHDIPNASELATKLRDAKSLALSKLANPTCAQLFANTSYNMHNGVYIIRDFTIYRDGTNTLEAGRRLCVGSRPAYTRQHGRRVLLCRDAFLGQTESEAAITIIHEALHTAGQSECLVARPAGPNNNPPPCPTTEMLNDAVRRACP